MKDVKKMLGMGKMEGKGMDKEHLLALRDVLDELIKMSTDEAGKSVKSGLDGLQKVTVAAPSQEGLAEGLEKAQELMGTEKESDDEVEEKQEEALETPEGLKEAALEKIVEKSDEEEEDMGFFKPKKKRML
jgi:negative regulator of genetic competence, sporulation and motility